MRVPRVRRLRFSILAVMGLIAVAALIFGWVAADRRRRAAAFADEIRRRDDRVRWAEAMFRRGYVPKTTVAAERAARDSFIRRSK
jgi:hypothetical protein